jgi:hypothetical protein
MVHFRSGLDLDEFTMSVRLPLEHVRQENLLGYSSVLVFRNTANSNPLVEAESDDTPSSSCCTG